MSELPQASTPSVPLLSTKLAVPPLHAGLVSRPRLIEHLNQGLRTGHQITLVSAPAGFGKTTLVSAWLRYIDRPSAWLSLDEGDNDAVRFLSYFITALQKVDPKIGGSVQALQQSPAPIRPETLWIALINDIAVTPHPLLMVIDDYHSIHSMQIHQQLASLLDHMPQQMHLVISTREDPPLPLSRLRARGQISEVRQADLRFSLDEAAVFLNTTMGLNLTAEDIAALDARTEGWIAGLQLAALSMRQADDIRGFVQSFTGSNRYILDYLTDEVIERQPPAVREFLLQTSLLERLSAPLCDAVTGRENSEGTLLALEQGNLFVVPLDESRQWYRYHGLFAELLRHRLRTEAGWETIKVLHGRARRWYAEHGSAEEAIRHALAAQDWEQAATLIQAESSTLLNRGEVSTLLRWMRSLPDDIIRASPQLCCSYAWPLVISGQIKAGRSYLQIAEEAAPDDPALQSHIAATRAHIARAQGDMPGVVEWSERALSLLPRDDLTVRAVVAVGLGMGHWYLGHVNKAEEAFSEAELAAQQSRNVHAATFAQTFLGRIKACRSKLHGAILHYQQGIEFGAEQPAAGMCYMDRGTIRYEWNDLDGAVEDLKRGVELSQRGGSPDITVYGQAQLALTRLAQRDTENALAALEEARRGADSIDPGAVIHAQLAAYQVQAALALGDLDTAMRWAQRLGDRPDFAPFYPWLRLTAVRLLLAQSEKAEAAERAEAAYGLACRAGWNYGAIGARTLQALASPVLEQGLAYLADALSQAEPEGYARIFLDQGEPLITLLREAAVRGISPAYVGRLLADLTAPVEAPPPDARRGIQEQPLPEPLSGRELETLRLLGQGLSNQEIAAAMFLSLSTIKTHLKNVYAKLGVHNRQDAVVRAGELRLLP